MLSPTQRSLTIIPAQMPIILSQDQQVAYNEYAGFIIDPNPGVLVIEGYAGTGKSTLVQRMVEDTESLLKTGNLLTQKENDWEMQLTATTNKAAEALHEVTGYPVSTIQSFLKLIVKTDYKNGKTKLVKRNDCENIDKTILFIDESSFINEDLLDTILELASGCKIVFIGDPAQLAPVKSKVTPVFCKGFNTVSLTEVLRQAKGNPIIDLATSFREVVNGQPFFQFSPDNHHIVHLPRGDFEKKIVEEFSDPTWTHKDSKVLAWRNAAVEAFNLNIRDHVHGQPELQVDDYAVVNGYFNNGSSKLCSNQMVQITSIKPETSYSVKGWEVMLDHNILAFLPENIKARVELERRFKKEDRWGDIKNISQHWIDLRAAYSCTINKSQGSTYKSVFIDLDDVSRCRDGQQIARLLYVAVSRASNYVYLTGDLV